jgi:nuclear cap-binding protein subunit 2
LRACKKKEMAELFHSEDAPQRIYWDRRYYTTFDEQEEALKGSSTLYVGNLQFRTTEPQIEKAFERVGPVKKIIMGLNRETKAHCGFAFVEYHSHEHAVACIKYISGTYCDEAVIRCELDAGFKPGRQYGRGQSGGQVRDERRGGAGGIKYGDAGEKGKRKKRDGEGKKSKKEKEPKDAITLLTMGLSAPRESRKPDSEKAGLSAPAASEAGKKRGADDSDDDDDDLLAEIEGPTKKRRTGNE